MKLATGFLITTNELINAAVPYTENSTLKTAQNAQQSLKTVFCVYWVIFWHCNWEQLIYRAEML